MWLCLQEGRMCYEFGTGNIVERKVVQLVLEYLMSKTMCMNKLVNHHAIKNGRKRNELSFYEKSSIWGQSDSQLVGFHLHSANKDLITCAAFSDNSGP